MRALDRRVYKGLFLLWVLALFWVVQPWRLISFHKPKVTTTVTIYRGEVTLYGFDDYGRREFRRVVDEGDSVMITEAPLSDRLRVEGEDSLGSSEINQSISKFFNVLRLLLPKEAEYVNQALLEIARKYPDGEYTRVFTEQEFRQFVLTKLEQRTPFKDIELYIHPHGVSGYGTFQLGPIKLLFELSGVVQVVPKNNDLLDLRIHYVKFGSWKLPEFMLRKLESDFMEFMTHSQLAIRYRRIVYQNKSAIVTYFKSTGTQ